MRTTALRFAILMILALTANVVEAQDVYSDMLADGKTWSFIRWPYGNTHCEGMRGDTIINGMTCRKYGYYHDLERKRNRNQWRDYNRIRNII